MGGAGIEIRLLQISELPENEVLAAEGAWCEAQTSLQ